MLLKAFVFSAYKDENVFHAATPSLNAEQGGNFPCDTVTSEQESRITTFMHMQPPDPL